MRHKHINKSIFAFIFFSVSFYLSSSFLVSALEGKEIKNVKLYGRIEEICGHPGASLPKLQPQVPHMDNSHSLNGQVQTAKTIRPFYPDNWQGYWAGTLKVWSTQFDPGRRDFDAQEVEKEKQLVRPGIEGQVSFNFTSDTSHHIQLEPTQVLFTAKMDESRFSDLIKQMLPSDQATLNQLPGGQMAMQILKSMPYMYALHLGNLTGGVGVTGNLLENKLVKNEIKVLQPGTLEQDIITYNIDQSKTTGAKHYGYCETVLRFTRIKQDQLYVQAASVGYDHKGAFEDKIVLYGTVNRSSAPGPQPTNFINGQFFNFPQ